MKYSYIYEPRAIQEYEEAALWYLEKSKQAAEHFENAMNEKLREVCLHPRLYRNTKKQFREAFLVVITVRYFIAIRLHMLTGDVVVRSYNCAVKVAKSTFYRVGMSYVEKALQI
jgi:plasmid stabilization system protein ParE